MADKLPWEGVMVDGTTMPRRDYEMLLALARKAVLAQHWCPLCSITLGTDGPGDTVHRDDCILWRKGDDE